MAGASGGSRFSRRKRRVRQLDNSSLTLRGLSPRAQKILQHLGAGNSASQVARMIQCSKPTMNYWKNKFVAMGAIRLQCKDVVHIWSLTPFGSKLLTRSEGAVFVEPLVLEDCAVKFGVLDWGRSGGVDWCKLGEPRNWEKLGCRVGGVRVIRTSGSIIVHPGRLRGFSGEEHALQLMAGRIVEWVKQILEGKFDMVFEEEGVPLHEPIFRFYSEDAREDVKHGTIITEGVGSTDNSPPERVPHEEYVGVERAHARHLLPDSVKRIENKVDVLTETLQRVVSSFEKLTGSFESFVGMFKQATGPVEPQNHGNGEEYVS